MVEINRIDANQRDFIALVKLLDAELAARDGQLHAFYHQFNQISHIQFALVAYKDRVAVGCGAIKQWDSKSMEVKRMFVLPEHRGQGIASRILDELESWARELGYQRCVLETGKNQPEAIKLYYNKGYITIPNYGQYAGVDNSICFEKRLS